MHGEGFAHLGCGLTHEVDRDPVGAEEVTGSRAQLAEGHQRGIVPRDVGEQAGSGADDTVRAVIDQGLLRYS